LASGQSDRTLRVWDAHKGGDYLQQDVLPDKIRAIAPSFDGVTPLDWAKNCVGLARFFVDQGAVLDAMSCCRAGVAAARLDGVDDDPDEPRGSVVADAHKCWAQAHVSCAESFIATRRTVPTCTEKDAH